jgi:hypothetical protein
MAGGRHGRKGIAAAVLFMAGCVGLDDALPLKSQTNAPKTPVAAPQENPDDHAVAQAKRDIPLVPLPTLTPPTHRTFRPPSPPAVPAARTDIPPSPQPQVVEQPQEVKLTPSAPHSARQLLERAAARCASLDSYIVRLTRREHLKGKGNAEEIIAFSFRKNPFSVHFKWLGETAKGREVVYVKDRFGNKIHTKVAGGDAPLLPAGARLSLSPDNPLVRSASRHPITDAGVGHCVESLIEQLNAQERGDTRQGTLTVLPPQKRPEYAQPIETLERIIPPGIESELPRGGRRLIYFEADTQLPMLVVTLDDKGNEVEYYRYDRLMTPVSLDDDDFNPDKLWATPSKQQAVGGRK